MGSGLPFPDLATAPPPRSAHGEPAAAAGGAQQLDGELHGVRVVEPLFDGERAPRPEADEMAGGRAQQCWVRAQPAVALH